MRHNHWWAVYRMRVRVSVCLCRHKKCVQRLVEAGADIRQHDNEGLTAVSRVGGREEGREGGREGKRERGREERREGEGEGGGGGGGRERRREGGREGGRE